MGLYIKLKKLGYPPIPFTEAVVYKAQGALILIKPFINYFNELKFKDEVKIGIYMYHPGYSDSNYKPIEMSAKPSLLSLEKIVREGLERAYTRWKRLYGSVVVIRLNYALDDELVVPLRLFVFNGPFEGADIELNVAPFIVDDEVVSSLEEILKVLDIRGFPDLEELLRHVGAMNEWLRPRGYTVEKAVIAEHPEALNDMRHARLAWLPSKAKILSYALDTIQSNRDEGGVITELYDRFAPYRKDLIVSMIANRREYELYLRRQAREVVEILEGHSVILKPKGENLAGLFSKLISDVLEPYSRHVLSTTRTKIRIATEEFFSEWRERLEGSLGSSR